MIKTGVNIQDIGSKDIVKKRKDTIAKIKDLLKEALD